MNFLAEISINREDAQLELASVVTAKFPMPIPGKWKSRYQTYGFMFVFVPDEPAADVPADQDAA